MIEFVTLAEDFISTAPEKKPARASGRSAPAASAAAVAPIIRGTCAADLGEGQYRHLIAEHRSSEAILGFVNGAELASYSQRGVVTPDHIIRTKNLPLLAPLPLEDNLDGFETQVREAAKRYRENYIKYFEANNARAGGIKIMLDPSPRVVLVPGVGLFGLGTSAGAAKVAADLAEITIDTILKAERIGQYEALSDEELFDMEYWSLEQAKLGKHAPKPLAGQVAVVTGGGGAIGAAVAKLFAKNGAEIAVLDVNPAAAQGIAEAIGGAVQSFACDVTDVASIHSVFEGVCNHFGGIDILVSNAGAAWEGGIATLDDAVLRKSFELNFFAHQNLAKAAVAIMKRQGTGGALLFNASKQAVNPGSNFGAYGLPKAATLFLSRQYALECGVLGIRSNAVNADRIRSGLLTDEMVKSRAASRGLSEKDYLQGNLLGLEVRADDVAQAFLHQALAKRTTGDVTTVDGGNIAAALR